MRPLVLVLLLAGCRPSHPDYSGVWRMEETDSRYRQSYSECRLEILQYGERAELRATGRDWECDGRGELLSDGRLRFRWAGEQKSWRGWAELRFTGTELQGIYVREDAAGTTTQYCRGRRIR